MRDEEQNLIEEFDAPYNRKIKLESIIHESGMVMLRMHIREGRRFTIMDLDAETAKKLGQHILTWAEAKT
jgi:hypothetical protein